MRTVADLDPRVRLTADDFKILDEANSGAFLLWHDAVAEIRNTYQPGGTHPGLIDSKGQRRIVRVTRLASGTRLFKAADYRLQPPLRTPLSPWWSLVDRTYENRNGARELLQTAEMNGIAFRDLIRFVSAVSVDWNRLDNYLEIILAQPIYAFWGQFAPQSGLQSAPRAGMATTMRHGTLSGWSTYVDHGDGRQVHLPEMLGGFGAWQLYIPNFDIGLIDQGHLINIDARDNHELDRYFGGQGP